MDSSADPSWSLYSETLLHFPDAALVVDLRREVAVLEAARLRTLGLGPRFCVLTAFNPRGRAVDRSENDRAHAQLGARLRTTGGALCRCDGGDPSGSHIELGWATSADAETSLRLAIELGQSACFEFDGERFWLRPGVVRSGSLPLPKPRA